MSGKRLAYGAGIKGFRSDRTAVLLQLLLQTFPISALKLTKVLNRKIFLQTLPEISNLCRDSEVNEHAFMILQ